MEGVPYKSELVDIDAGDHTFASEVHALYCGSAGTVTARLTGDESDSEWPVQPGQYLLGQFRVVRQNGTTPMILRGVTLRR